MKNDLLGMLKFRAVQLSAITALIVGVGTECFITKLSVLDLDVWWHLAVGNWILDHHTFPHNGILSRTAANRPWMAYSWGYEVLLARSYDWFGFVGMMLFGTALTIAVALAVFWMLHRLSGRFWLAWILSILVISAFLFNIMPRPVFFSMLLYAVTLTFILEAQRSGRMTLLYWLPLVFALWSNLHIQFVYGLILLGLLAGISVVQRVGERFGFYPDSLTKRTLSVVPLFAILLCCVIATCIGPYSFHLYRVLFGYSNSKVFYSMISELQSLSFEGVSHFLELLLAAAAFFAIGWAKKIDPFKLLLMVIASIFAFRATRDAWFLCITAVAVIADFPSEHETRDRHATLPQWGAVALASIVLLALVARNTDLDSRHLTELVSQEFPVDAVNFVRNNPVEGPLYNSFDWGGFLIFSMPQYPVAVDGRGDLYGDEVFGRVIGTEAVNMQPSDDPYFNEARLIILKNSVPLSKLLPTDKKFRVIYRDQIATVLARN